MPVRDNFHNTVKNALIREGWKITHDPYFMRYGDTEFYIDLGAEKILAAEKEGRKIAVEIKSFLGDSTVYEFHTALGQFISYRNILEEIEPDRTLYLAVPADIFDSFFRSRFGQMAVRKNQIRLIVYNAAREEIESWTN
ncbi:MAG: XisH family protein [Desulfococcaceae bacterium]